MVSRQPSFPHLSSDQEVAGDVQLLLVRVPRQTQRLHPVQKWCRDRIQRVGRGDEEHLGQIKRQVQVVVAEFVVLRRIEDFQQGGGRITPEIAAHLVHFVEHQQGVLDGRPPDGLEDAPRHGADVRTPVSPQLGLVVQSA